MRKFGMSWNALKNTAGLVLIVMAASGDAAATARKVMESNHSDAANKDPGNSVATMYYGTGMDQQPTALIAVGSARCNNFTDPTVMDEFLAPIARAVQDNCGTSNNRSMSFPGFANMTAWICEALLLNQAALTVRQLCTSGLFGIACLQSEWQQTDQNATRISTYMTGFTAENASVPPIINNTDYC